jgi:A/G-specific adenine glycosylase
VKSGQIMPTTARSQPQTQARPQAPLPHQPPQDNLPQMQTALLGWFAAHKRPLPWRDNYTPYEVWISEIMLQQTQMERGVEYFTRWMRRFPDIPTLAAASVDTVLRLWEGLGYYARARHALNAARKIMNEHGGVFPSDPQKIRDLPGIGPYTAGAIASIAFGEKLPCVDANVERVLSRVFNVDSPARQAPAATTIQRLALRLVPEGQAREHNQAMMELGALVCGKKPRCENCPIAVFCIARHLGVAHERPVPGKKTVATAISVATGVLWRQGRVFVQKRHSTGIWGNLWEFPGGRVERGESPEAAVVREFLEETGFTVRPAQHYSTIRHGYTTYRITLHCFGLRLEEASAALPALPAPPALTAACDWRWATPEEISALPMPAPHRKLAERIMRPRKSGKISRTRLTETG